VPSSRRFIHRTWVKFQAGTIQFNHGWVQMDPDTETSSAGPRKVGKVHSDFGLRISAFGFYPAPSVVERNRFRWFVVENETNTK